MNMNIKELLKIIKSRGYWRVNFRPVADQTSLELPKCKEIVEKCSVEFRGWDYPHFPRRRGENTDLRPGNNYYEGWINWGVHKEIWRMYQSGQFIHYLTVREDWFKEHPWYSENLKKIEPKTILSIINTVYLITEIFEFLARLSKEGVYNKGVEVNIQLCNIGNNRKLEILEAMRAPLLREYKTGADNIEFFGRYSKDEVIKNSKEIALKAILHFFYRFSWDNPPIEVIKNDQEKLVTGKL